MQCSLAPATDRKFMHSKGVSGAPTGEPPSSPFARSCLAQAATQGPPPVVRPHEPAVAALVAMPAAP